MKTYEVTFLRKMGGERWYHAFIEAENATAAKSILEERCPTPWHKFRISVRVAKKPDGMALFELIAK